MWIFAITMPHFGIVGNITPRIKQLFIITNNLFVKITLPFKMFVSVLVAPFGDADFKSTYHSGQRTGDGLLKFVGFPFTFR
jgi:hypothetical protein